MQTSKQLEILKGLYGSDAFRKDVEGIDREHVHWLNLILLLIDSHLELHNQVDRHMGVS